jgi:hypothetical protein
MMFRNNSATTPQQLRNNSATTLQQLCNNSATTPQQLCNKSASDLQLSQKATRTLLGRIRNKYATQCRSDTAVQVVGLKIGKDGLWLGKKRSSGLNLTKGLKVSEEGKESEITILREPVSGLQNVLRVYASTFGFQELNKITA